MEVPLEPEIGHHRADDAGLLQAAVFLPARRDYGEQLIAVDHLAAFVGDHNAVGVAVERDANIGPHLPHLAAERGRPVEPHSWLMLEPSGSTPIAIPRPNLP